MQLKSDAEEEEKDMSQDTEITLGTGKLLGIFFGLVLVCGAFFTLGYMLGHSTASAGAATQIIGAATPSGSPAGKPSAVNSKTPETTVQNCPPGSANCTPPANGPDSNFVNAVSDKTPNTQLTPDTSQPAGTAATPPQPAGANPTGTAGPYMVQVAAVSKQEDAELLVNALRKKQYPVFSSTVAGDTFYHVQVGPFNDIKEAESMRTRLAGDGYNAIVKK